MDDLKHQIKQLIVRALMLEEITPEQIGDDQPLFGEGLGLDSVDALELAVELEREFGVRLPDDKASRGVFRSVDTLAAFVSEARGSA